MVRAILTELIYLQKITSSCPLFLCEHCDMTLWGRTSQRRVKMELKGGSALFIAFLSFQTVIGNLQESLLFNVLLRIS